MKLYNKLLVWDIAKKPAVTRITEQVLNPVLGKSLVVYATKPIARTRSRRPPVATGARPAREMADADCLTSPAS